MVLLRPLPLSTTRYHSCRVQRTPHRTTASPIPFPHFPPVRLARHRRGSLTSTLHSPSLEAQTRQRRQPSRLPPSIQAPFRHTPMEISSRSPSLGQPFANDPFPSLWQPPHPYIVCLYALPSLSQRSVIALSSHTSPSDSVLVTLLHDALHSNLIVPGGSEHTRRTCSCIIIPCLYHHPHASRPIGIASFTGILFTTASYVIGPLWSSSIPHQCETPSPACMFILVRPLPPYLSAVLIPPSSKTLARSTLSTADAILTPRPFVEAAVRARTTTNA